MQLMTWLPKSAREDTGYDGVLAVKLKHYCEAQWLDHLNMRADASDEDRAS